MYRLYDTVFKTEKKSISEKLLSMSFLYLFFIIAVGVVGVAILYSAGSGNWQPWALPQLVRFLVGFVALFVLAMIDIRFFAKYAYIFYFLGLILLLIVEIFGHIGMGAQRWIDLGFFKLQPSEFMKIALVLALAKYFHNTALQQIESTRGIMPPIIMALLPIGLIYLQPDLGTALMLLFVTGAILFAVGVQVWKFVAVGTAGILSLPVLWYFMHDYQRNRVLTFLNPERDQLGAGYHIIQSKIALGSGGLFGKGFLDGSQSHLNFLPEKHTDFIFTMLAEELGFVGALGVLFLNVLIIVCGYIFAFRTTSYFGKLVIIGLNTNYFLYVFINIAMVLGLLPVVGVPLPLISYGGTVILSIMASFGIIMSAYINRDENFIHG